MRKHNDSAVNAQLNAIGAAVVLNHLNKQGDEGEKKLQELFKANGVKKPAHNRTRDYLEMKVNKFRDSDFASMFNFVDGEENSVDYDVNTDEAMSTPQVGFGKDFVPEQILADGVIARVRDAETLLQFIPDIKTMAGPTVDYPAEGSDVRLKLGIENSDVPWTEADLAKAGTAKIRLEAKKLWLTIYYSEELLEDSVVDMARYIEQKFFEAFVTSMHQVIINGDTVLTANNNINANDGTPPTGIDYTRFDGLRKKALNIAASGGIVDAGTFALEDIRAARKKMWLLGVDPSQLILTVGHETYLEMLGFSQVETIEKFGSAATVVDGVLKSIDGIRILPRKEQPKTIADGTVSLTPATNDKGSATLIHLPSVILGFKRFFRILLDYDQRTEQFYATGSTRFGLNFNDNNDGEMVCEIINITL